MKRVAEVKKRREHAFWKNRYLMKQSLSEAAERCPGWLQVGRSSKLIGRSNRKVELLSVCSNHWPIHHHPRRSKQKSRISRSPGVPLLLERVDLWLWRSTRVLSGADYQSLICPFVGDFRFKDIMIQAYELRASKKSQRTMYCMSKRSTNTLSIDACTLRHSHGVSLGPWNYEARVRFY